MILNLAAIVAGWIGAKKAETCRLSPAESAEIVAPFLRGEK
jgi:hypothetical protein